MQVMLTTSSDGGTTWGTPTRVTSSDTGDEFFPWINIASNGRRIGLTWLDRRGDPNNRLYQPFYAQGSGTRCCGNAHALTTTMSDPTKGGSFGSFIGDYRASIWIGKNIDAVWPDTRTGSAQCEFGGVALQ